MRLLNARTKKLEEFFDKNIPKYAILSHTWGDDEVTFRDFDPIIGPRRTPAKIDGCCTEALTDGYDYVWIDTCCIDKSSSAELSEAINSMFVWYARAEICYVYLSDVVSNQVYIEFNKSRWFTRGWTLQELLAPRVLRFYNTSWLSLGRLLKSDSPLSYYGSDMASLLADITGIPRYFIDVSGTLNMASIATKMSWASKR
jgi:Heterokaryon incompatibility protein (HET)